MVFVSCNWRKTFYRPVFTLWCTLQSPGEFWLLTVLRPLPIPVKSESLGVVSRHKYTIFNHPGVSIQWATEFLRTSALKAIIQKVKTLYANPIWREIQLNTTDFHMGNNNSYYLTSTYCPPVCFKHFPSKEKSCEVGIVSSITPILHMRKLRNKWITCSQSVS